MMKDKTIKSYKIYIKTHKKALNKIIANKGFNVQQTNEILHSAHNNIIVRLFLNVVSIEEKQLNEFMNEIALILIVSRFINLNIVESNQEIINAFMDKINLLKAELKITLDDNLENNLLYKINSKNLLINHPHIFDKHKAYMAIANMFVVINPRRKRVIYNYAYLITMYLYICFEYKKNKPSEAGDIFLLKLKINDELIASTIKLSSLHFNSLILKTNYWINNLNIKTMIKKGK